jgi:hypothetical protein
VGLSILLTLYWELPVAIFATLKLAGAGFVAGWPGGVIAAIAIGVVIWSFSLALAGSMVAALNPAERKSPPSPAPSASRLHRSGR